MEPDFSETIELVHQANQGDRDALERLLERYRPRVQRIVAIRMGQKLSEIHEDDDLVQETLIAVFRGLHTFQSQSQGAFRNWLACLIENEIRDRARHAQAKKRGSGREQRMADYGSDVLTESVFAGIAPSPSQIYRLKELENRLHGELLSLSDRHRQVIDLRQLCGMSYEEVAQEMDLETEDAARALFSRAMAKLTLRLARPD